jgi:hypothetical protein
MNHINVAIYSVQHSNLEALLNPNILNINSVSTLKFPVKL